MATTSKTSPCTGAKPSPRRTLTRSATPFSVALSRAHCTAASTMSVAITCAPARAASTAASPMPVPISSMRSPARTGRWRQNSNEPALGGCAPAATRNVQPR